MAEFPKVKSKREDANSWFAKIEKEEIEFALPKSFDFLRPIQKAEINRLKKRGWNLKNTVFLEIPYMLYFTSPSETCSYLIDLQKKDAYFQVVIFTHGYITSAESIELEDTILHEIDHLAEHRTKGETSGGLPVGEVSNAAQFENIVHEEDEERYRTRDELIKKYGLEKTTNALFAADKKRVFKMHSTPILFPTVLEFWLERYLSANFANFKEEALELPVTMKGGQWAESWKRIRNKAWTIYEEFGGYKLP